jgi:hypothetical protein
LAAKRLQGKQLVLRAWFVATRDSAGSTASQVLTVLDTTGTCTKASAMPILKS